MARTQVQSELIATNAISGTIIADNAITATHIAQNSISGILIPDSGITTTMIASNNVTAAKIVTGAVANRHLASTVISSQSAVTAASGDYVLIGDTSDSNNLKKALVSDFATDITGKLNLSGGTMTGDLTLRGYNGPVITLGSSSGNDPRIDFEDQNSTNHAGSLFYDQDADIIRLLRTVSGSAVDGIAINASGQVGIGTASPSEKLFIENTTDSTDVGLTVRNTGSAGGEDAMINLYAHASGGDPAIRWHITGTESWTMGLDNSDSDKLMISNGSSLPGTNYMTFTAGKVGIGTDAPAQKLHVVGGQARFDDHVSIQPDKRLYLDGGNDTWIEEYAANEMGFYTGGAQRLKLSGGSVHVVGSGEINPLKVASDGNCGISLDTTQSNGDEFVIRSIVNGTTPMLQIRNEDTSTNLFHIDGSNGYVGIGTASPGGMLETYNASNYAKHWRIHRPGTAEFGIGVVGANFHLSSGSSIPASSNKGLFMTFNTGEIGIWAEPTSGTALKVNGSVSFDSLSYDAAADQMNINNGLYLSSGYMRSGNAQLAFGTAAQGSYVNLSNSGKQLTVGGSTPHSANRLSVLSPDANVWLTKFYNSTTANNESYLLMNSGGTPSYWQHFNTASATVFVVTGNGNVTNANNSYGSTSDIKLKQDVVDCNSQLEKLKDIRVRNFAYKTNPDKKLIGMVAQELETHYPNLIEETPDIDDDGEKTGETTKNIKYSVFVPILIKSIQELEARLAALE